MPTLIGVILTGPVYHSYYNSIRNILCSLTVDDLIGTLCPNQ